MEEESDFVLDKDGDESSIPLNILRADRDPSHALTREESLALRNFMSKSGFQTIPTDDEKGEDVPNLEAAALEQWNLAAIPPPRADHDGNSVHPCQSYCWFCGFGGYK